jgi:YVTN family beta-propeller protein
MTRLVSNLTLFVLTAAAIPALPACTGNISNGAPADAGDEPVADADPNAPDATPPPPGSVLKRASKSSTVAITGDDVHVLMVNPEDDSLSIFDVTTETRLAKIATGDEPSSVVIGPDDKTAYVANRAAATVVKVSGIDGSSPAIAGTTDVGSEPIGLALSPTGAKLFVAEFAEGRISVIDTASMTITGTITAPLHPRALAVTNNGDGNDADETLVVPEYFGEPIAGAETLDASRTGRVRLYSVGDLSAKTPITFAPRDSGFAPDGSPQGTPTVQTSPNQLSGVVVQNGKIYVTSVSVSPAGPTKFNTNVQPVVYVGDLATSKEDTSPVGTTNMAKEVKDELPAPRFFLADIVDMAFVTDKNVGYVLSRGGDVMQRVVYDETQAAPADQIKLGSTFNGQIDLAIPTADNKTCLTPTGLVVAHAAARAYVNCWVSKSLGVVDFSTQELTKTIPSWDAVPADAAVDAGRRFFFTARGRWSKDAWSACSSCHPDGLSDNVTWSFGTGPRQTVSMDGTFSHSGGAQQQRILNWTGIFDELHDFERNTRGVSGGLGAITTAAPGGACVKDGGSLATEVQDPPTAAIGGATNLAQPMKELSDRAENCTKDWDKIEAFVKTIRPARALRTLDAASVARGAALFGEPSATASNGGCVRCHGGPGWTASRRFFTPASATNATLATAAVFTKPQKWPAGWTHQSGGFQIAPQPAEADTTGAVIQPAQVSCTIRDVQTFGIPGDPAATDALEHKDSGAADRAPGAGGFNVPSLYGLALSAPYLHHGQAATLEALFEDPRWADHLRAANANFLLDGGDPVAKEKDLINFLLSIDADTTVQAIPTGWDGCPAGFP